MALIKCTECGKEISDKATICPNCGCPLDNDDTPKTETMPTNISVPAKKTKKTAFVIIIIGIVAILAIIVGIFLYRNYSQRKLAAEKEAYIDTAYDFSLEILYAAAKCEDAGNLIKSVWYNTIFEVDDPETDEYTKLKMTTGFYDDFNISLTNLFSSDEYSEMLENMESDYEKISQFAIELKNAPEGLEEIGEAVSDTYKNYKKLYDNATDPTGSLETYSSDFSENDTNTVDSYDELQFLIEAYRKK